MSWRENAAEVTGSEQKEPLTKGKFNDLKVIKYWGVTQKDHNRHSLSVVSQSRDGFASMYIQLEPDWLQDGVIVLAMGEDAVKQAVDAGEVTTHDITRAHNVINKLVAQKLEAANTPEEARDEAFDTAKRNILTQIKINVGQVWRLQEWAGLPLNEHADLSQLVGTVFAGRVEEFNGKLSVKDVYKPKKDYVAPERETAFQTA